MKIGSIIKKLRVKSGYSQKEFAVACSLSASYLSQIENNSRYPHESTLKDIAKVLEVPVGILFFLTIEPDDVPERKREAFEVLFPTIESFLIQLFPVAKID